MHRRVKKSKLHLLSSLLLGTRVAAEWQEGLIVPFSDAFAEFISFRANSLTISRRETRLMCSLSKWRDYKLEVARPRLVVVNVSATAIPASSTPRKIIRNKIVIYARVPGKRAAQTLHYAPLVLLVLQLVFAGTPRSKTMGTTPPSPPLSLSLTFFEDYIIVNSSGTCIVHLL